MINKVTITNSIGQSVILELRSPEKSGFLVQRIDGLGPIPANISTTDLTTLDGTLFNSAHISSRNIVLSLALLPFPTVETTRQNSYHYFPTKKRVDILIESDNRNCRTYGYVESNTIDIFNKQVISTVSIICPDAYLYAPEPTTTVWSGVTSNFEFPFSNESLNSKLIEFGLITIASQTNIFYDGDADTGITIYMHALGTATDIAIYNASTGEVLRIDTTKLQALTGQAITLGDEFIISTVQGNKYIYLLRNGVYTNILNALGIGSNWIHITKGDNLLAYTAATGGINLQFRVFHNTLYEGV